MRSEILDREDIEWTNTWWENANDSSCKRILMIGDSVTRGIRPKLHEIVKKDYVVDLFASSLQITDPLLEKEILFHFSVKEYLCNMAIIQIGGQHGFERRCSEDKDYYSKFREYYLRFVTRIEEFCDNIIFLSATATVLRDKQTVLDDTRNEEIKIRNEIVRDIAVMKQRKYIDLYKMTETCQHVDQIHMDYESYEKIAREIAGML